MTDERPLILVADDDAAALNAVCDALHIAGYKTISVVDGQLALDQALEVHPALVISDNLMPVMTGLEVLEKLRADEWGQSVPVIILTSQFDNAAINDSLGAGNTDFLIKDETSLEDIVTAVGRRLDQVA